MLLSRFGSQLAAQDYRFERLEVDATIALEMFANNR